MEELIVKYLTEQAIILVPVLWVIGVIIKRLGQIKNKYIPLILLVIGIILANLYLTVSVDASLQGVLAVGLAVFVHQIKTQTQK